jgi:iron complex outermembrane receptor protein
MIGVALRSCQGARQPLYAQLYFRVLAAVLLGIAAAPSVVNAQARASENVVTQAEDAFGISVGNESIGLYSRSSVRGFSPTTAGNVRIDGLYFDQAAELGNGLARATNIRVGLSAFGFSFPAPTGVVDYQMRRPGDQLSRSVFLSVDTQRAFTTEADVVLPIEAGRLSLGLGAGVYGSEYDNGTDSVQSAVRAMLRWRPREDLELMPFFNRANSYDNESGPSVVPAGPTLPPRMERRRFRGPDWVDSDRVSTNYGGLAQWQPAPDWTARLGLFRSVSEEGVSYSNLMVNVTPQGVGRQIISVDPPSETASTSGEIRLTRSLATGTWLHQFHLSTRGRDRERLSGGSVQYDLGLISLFEDQTAPEPNHLFSELTRETVRQWIGGLAYEGRWRGRGELSLGVQYTDYQKVTDEPGQPLALSNAGLTLWNAAVAVNLTQNIVIYGGSTRGLEESGIAPIAAANRNAALPAIRTEQAEAGLRWRVRPGVSLVAGVFDIRKPYFNLDELSVWRDLGEVRNRGVELSLSGEVAPGLNILAGAVFFDALVTGDAVRLGRVGRRPVGSSPRTLLFSADWRPPWLANTSFNLGVAHAGDTVATRDNRAEIPARTTLDLGMRYRLQIAGSNATLRAQVRNVTDKYGFSLRGSGAFGVTTGRVASISLTADF